MEKLRAPWCRTNGKTICKTLVEYAMTCVQAQHQLLDLAAWRMSRVIFRSLRVVQEVPKPFHLWLPRHHLRKPLRVPLQAAPLSGSYHRHGELAVPAALTCRLPCDQQRVVKRAHWPGRQALAPACGAGMQDPCSRGVPLLAAAR
jgi:hypothetical protein